MKCLSIVCLICIETQEYYSQIPASALYMVAWEKEEQGSGAVNEIPRLFLLQKVYPNIEKLSRNSVDTASRARA